MCTYVKVVRYFLGIVGIIGFCDFVIFSNRCNTLILYLVLCVFKNIKNIISSMDIGIIDRTMLKP